MTMEESTEETSTENSERFEESAEPGGVLLKWRALERPFKERNQSWFTTVAVIVVLSSFVALFLKEFLLLGVIFSVAFVSYVLATKRPDFVSHKITTEGVISGDKMYSWDKLENFYFKNLSGEEVLVINLKKGFPSQLILLLGDASAEQIKNTLSNYLGYIADSESDWMEKSAHWFSEKVGLE